MTHSQSQLNAATLYGVIYQDKKTGIVFQEKNYQPHFMNRRVNAQIIISGSSEQNGGITELVQGDCIPDMWAFDNPAQSPRFIDVSNHPAFQSLRNTL